MNGTSYTFALEDGGRRVGALTVAGEDEQDARVQARQILGVRQLHGSPSVGPVEPDWQARAEAALRKAEEALERDRGPGVVGAEGSHEEQAIREALTILKRARTTTTKEVPHA